MSSLHKTIPLVHLCLTLAALGASGCIEDDRVNPVHLPDDTPDDTGEPPPLDEPLDWRDQVIYFIVTDRFNDGDPSNNDQGAGEYDPADGARYSGGDLQGITDKIDYIRDLGATAIWITPPVANQWWDGQVNYGGYHGYWAENFTEVDKHCGDLATYKALSAALHERGMLLVQDIVVNHTGNFFHCDPAPAGGEPACASNTQSVPVTAPTQPPFDKDDPNSASDRAASIYHFTPAISDFTSDEQRFDYALADLDDLDTDNPEVLLALKDSYNHWIKEVGVDGFRIDTVIYTHPEIYADFIHSTDPEHPGVKTFAEGDGGKQSFFTFGETWFTPTAYDDSADRRVEEYIEKDGVPLIDSALNFPLHFDLQAVFAGGKPTRQLGYRLEKAFSVHKDPERLVNFIDNHDRDRFLSIASPAALKQALAFILTIPGVPVIYYGTEQSFTEQRGSMFAAGVDSGGVDHFDKDAEIYRFLQEMIALRKQHPAFRRGTPRLLRDSGAGPGVFGYVLQGEGESAVVLFNTSEHRALVDGADTGLPTGAELQLVSGLSAGGDLTVGAEGQLVADLAPRSISILLTTGVTHPVPEKDVAVTLDFPEDTAFSTSPLISGTLTGADELLLVIDGDLSTAQPVTVASDGTWSATLHIENMTPDPSIVHSVAVYVESAGVVCERRDFTVDLDFVPVTEVLDPDGDDHGPTSAYNYPTDATYANPTMDIHKVTVTAAGNTLRFSFQMNALSAVWNPVFGFDHVSFSIYVDVPGKTGVAALPFQNANAPDGMQWDTMALVGGWVNAVYSADGASATTNGESVSSVPTVSVDKAARTIDLTFIPASFGDLPSLSGVRIYIATWDYDNGYRPLTPLPEPWKFSGGDGAVSPLIMDDVLVTLP